MEPRQGSNMSGQLEKRASSHNTTKESFSEKATNQPRTSIEDQAKHEFVSDEWWSKGGVNDQQ